MEGFMTAQEEAEEPKPLTAWTDAVACKTLCDLLLDDRCDPISAASRKNSEDEEADEAAEDQHCHNRCSRRKAVAHTPSSSTWSKRRPPLPAALYVELVAPFLRFEGPVPNMMYVFGGRVPLAGFQTLRPSRDIVKNSVEMLDTWHGRWVQCPPMPRNRAGAAAACLPDGRIIICGGYDERGVVAGLLSACDIFCPWEERWEAGASQLLRGRWGHGCASLAGCVYAVGGCSVWQPGMGMRTAFMETLTSCEVLVEESGRSCWQACGSLQVARSGARVVAVGEKHLVAVGGCEDPFGRVLMQASMEVYDAELRCWSLLDLQLGTPRTCAVVTALDDHRVLVAGGGNADQPPGAPEKKVEVISISAPCGKRAAARKSTEKLLDDCSNTPDLLTGRVGCQAAVVDLPNTSTGYPVSNQRCLLAIGGERCDRKAESQMFNRVLNLETGVWCSEGLVPPSISPPRTAVALCVGVGRVDGTRLRT